MADHGRMARQDCSRLSCSHPSYKGHEQIADAIMDALFQEEGTNTLPVTSLI